MGTPNPTPERKALVTAAGIQNVEAIAEASVATGVPFYAAVALIQGESNGKNIYGHDRGGYYSTFKELEVTPKNFLKFYSAVVLNGFTSNGVGPAQITYVRFFDLMLDAGQYPWVPVDNITFGLQRLAVARKSQETAGDWAKVGTLYNAGNLRSGVNTYGVRFADRVAMWKSAFGVK